MNTQLCLQKVINKQEFFHKRHNIQFDSWYIMYLSDVNRGKVVNDAIFYVHIQWLFTREKILNQWKPNLHRQQMEITQPCVKLEKLVHLISKQMKIMLMTY